MISTLPDGVRNVSRSDSIISAVGVGHWHFIACGICQSRLTYSRLVSYLWPSTIEGVPGSTRGVGHDSADVASPRELLLPDSEKFGPFQSLDWGVGHASACSPIVI